jgi:1-acyl-sn-glycerol-3-phosphate acyltransferase
MTCEEFQDRLRRGETYRTPEGAARGVGRFDAYYYGRIIGITRRAARLARRGAYDRQAWSRSSFDYLRAIEECGGRITISGHTAAASLAGPRVYISNHMSFAETFLLPVVLLAFTELTTVVKESLLSYPLFGTVMRAVRPISVTRTNPREDLKAVFDQGEAALHEGRSVLVFPQATRSVALDQAAFNSLGVKLARKADVPVVPLAVKTDFHGVGRIIRDFGRVRRGEPVHVRFGEVLSAANPKAAHEAVLAFVAQALAEWGVPVLKPSDKEGARTD